MAESIRPRARRPDSKQMWDEQDKRKPLAHRERNEPRERDKRDHHERDRERDRDRDHRYRSRSPRDYRSGRDRERDSRDGRGGGRREDRHDDRRDRRGEDRGGRRDRGGERDRDDHRTRREPKDRNRDSRSRSPRKEREIVETTEKDTEKHKIAMHDGEDTERFATPPVSFKVGGQDHDRMELEVDGAQSKKGDTKAKKNKGQEIAAEADEELVVEDDGMADMQAMMGFGGFGTTHQKKVAGNDVYAVRKEKKTEYRQYMNRVGGFNRPLSPPRQ